MEKEKKENVACENEEQEKEQAQETIKDEQENIEEQPKPETEDYKDKWMRSVAEFDNYKKRNARIYMDAFTEGASSVIVKILDIGDNLDWALTIGLDEKTAEGIKNLKKKYDETLKEIGVTEINPVGEPFDPNIAEAVMQADAVDGEESETVKQVFQKGYKLKEKIIRYAKVCVTK